MNLPISLNLVKAMAVKQKGNAVAKVIAIYRKRG